MVGFTGRRAVYFGDKSLLIKQCSLRSVMYEVHPHFVDLSIAIKY